MKKTILVLTVMALVLTSAFAGTTSQKVADMTGYTTTPNPNGKQSITVGNVVEEKDPEFQLKASTTSTGTFSGSDIAKTATTKNAVVDSTNGLTVYFRVDRSAYRYSLAANASKTVTISVSAGDMVASTDSTSKVSGSVTNGTMTETLTAGAAKDNVMNFSVCWKPASEAAAAALKADDYSATVTVTYTIS